MGDAIDLAAVNEVLSTFKDPETGRNVVATNQVQDIELQADSLQLKLGLTTHSAPLWEETVQELEQLLRDRLPGLSSVTIERVEHARAPQPLGRIGLTAKSVIAVASGKGGVGKSTVAVNMAISLQRFGCHVGIMDADVYGPSIPHLLGVEGRPEVIDNRVQPIDAAGIPVMSIGFMIPQGEAVIWRGPMLHGAITQFLRDTNWGDLDYLIIDMPPGTGDIALTLSQSIPLTGAVVVCTPQQLALIDATKAIAMFRKVNIPVLGMVENMSGFICPDCDKRYDIFGSGGAGQEAQRLEIPLLGEIPIHIDIRVRGDAGQSSANFEDDVVAGYYNEIVLTLLRNQAAESGENPDRPQLPVLG